MKLHLTDAKNHPVVTGYGAGYVAINNIQYPQPMIILPDRAPESWAVASFETLDAAAFTVLLAHNPEIIVLGTGATQRFAAPAVIRPLIEAGIGLETMNTPAACRTYNILTGEGRRVIAALFLP